jgi:glycyl-tRNA synthetase
MSEVKLEDIVSLCKRRGFIYPGSDVYGGLAGTWDYGPLGLQLKKNIMQLWWKMFVDDRDDMLGVDAAILMNQKVWQASGHVDTFTDPLIVCENCHNRFRYDQVVDSEEYNNALIAMMKVFLSELNKEGLEQEEVKELIKYASTSKAPSTMANISENLKEYNKKRELHNSVTEDLNKAVKALGTFPRWYINSYIHKKCPVCGEIEWGEPRQFNMMFKTNVGPVDDENSVSYLRPETAQGIFTNYRNIVDSFYPDLPFGIAQQGKAFRNEISPRDFIFRSREFEQMEIEYFIDPENWEDIFETWIKRVYEWTDAIGLPRSKVHELKVPELERAHYSKRTIDFEFDFPIGREELLGLAYRTDFDLKNIERVSGKSMEYRPKEPGAKAFVPHVIEPSFGVERAIMAVLTAAYVEDKANERIVLRLPKDLAPIKVAISPLLKNKPELVKKAREVYAALKKEYGNVMWDDNGNIGKRYRRQDEIGTPYCVVIDFDTLENDTVTVRDRDTTEQKRVNIKDLVQALA